MLKAETEINSTVEQGSNLVPVMLLPHHFLCTPFHSALSSCVLIPSVLPPQINTSSSSPLVYLYVMYAEKAFGEDGCLKQPKELSINKVGHGKVCSMLFSLGYKRPVVIQSMYIFKQPGIGGEVVPHQDNSFLYTEPPSCTGLWLALEDATITNGCLWAIPGSHKSNFTSNGLKRRLIRGENGVHFDRPSLSYDQKDFVPLEVKSGSLVVIHGNLVHQSFENQSPKSRHALSLHVVDTDGFKWDQKESSTRAPLCILIPANMAAEILYVLSAFVFDAKIT
ncbi:Phytanoyl-CoA dioxygenase 1 [Ananas comosus]|uniref:Phytanoyl-CoA dioxygenase 1 n=1 Tax=Ananas comosus TaxID=4615 RepID=A0A199VLV1_ANACO|nr:Phytanoyl-CoA dioxygenase 1 [Ananas comosus]